MERASLIISIVSLLIGIAGLIFTIITWTNTKDIAKQVAANKIKEIYPKEHAQFVEGLSMAQTSLKDGGCKYYIVIDLLKTCRKIQMYYDNWEPQNKKEINKFVHELEKIPEDKTIDETTRIKLQKKLIELQAMIERIGDLNGIGKNRD